MNFSEKLVYYRKRTGMSQETLAGKLNVTRQAVSKWESGQSEPDISTLQKICEAFDISISQFFGDDTVLSEQAPDSTVRHESKSIILMLIFIMIIFIASAAAFLIDFFCTEYINPEIINITGVTMLICIVSFAVIVIRCNRKPKDKKKK